MTVKSIFIYFGLVIFSCAQVSANQNKPLQILSGLTQPLLLKGGNLAVNYTFQNQFVIETSWGFTLDYENILTDKEKMKYNSIKSPLTGGFGFGYMPVKNLKILWEPKFTQFELETNAGEKFDYTTYSAGIGIYYDVFLWESFVIQPAIKYWPRLASTLKDDKKSYIDSDGVTQSHKARSPGNDGFIYNVSVGWAF